MLPPVSDDPAEAVTAPATAPAGPATAQSRPDRACRSAAPGWVSLRHGDESRPPAGRPRRGRPCAGPGARSLARGGRLVRGLATPLAGGGAGRRRRRGGDAVDGWPRPVAAAGGRRNGPDMEGAGVGSGARARGEEVVEDGEGPGEVPHLRQQLPLALAVQHLPRRPP
jgi:hypothetical protein